MTSTSTFESNTEHRFTFRNVHSMADLPRIVHRTVPRKSDPIQIGKERRMRESKAWRLRKRKITCERRTTKKIKNSIVHRCFVYISLSFQFALANARCERKFQILITVTFADSKQKQVS